MSRLSTTNPHPIEYIPVCILPVAAMAASTFEFRLLLATDLVCRSNNSIWLVSMVGLKAVSRWTVYNNNRALQAHPFRSTWERSGAHEYYLFPDEIAENECASASCVTAWPHWQSALYVCRTIHREAWLLWFVDVVMGDEKWLCVVILF